MAENTFSDEELDAAITAVADPARIRAAEGLVTRVAPSLARVLAAALSDGGWFDSAHVQAVRELSDMTDRDARLQAIRTLLAEETRLGMLVGVAIGFELAKELAPTHHSED